MIDSINGKNGNLGQIENLNSLFSDSYDPEWSESMYISTK